MSEFIAASHEASAIPAAMYFFPMKKAMATDTAERKILIASSLFAISFGNSSNHA
ncbi:hypothetical protein [Neisseria sp.]|uniref:hypothetical protein n=1 Tax=Neisseria sp. TaxID=192066 RepID=UPI0026DB0C96|nr:hypothetical protein [Neisseria sp.]MDO4907982.1 hypothetical protein [Neisseria sp.]